MVTNQASSIQTREFLEKISNLDKRISNIERTTQSPWIDWYNMPLSYFAYKGQSRDNIFVYQITDEIIPFETRFVIGDKVRVTYNNSYYYGYLTHLDKSNRRIGIFPISPLRTVGFTDIINATEIYWSKNVAPSGFDAFADYEPRVEYGIWESGNLVYRQLSCSALSKFAMSGKQVVYSLSVNVSALPSNVSYIQVFTPFTSIGSGVSSVEALTIGEYTYSGENYRDVIQQVSWSNFSDTQSYLLEQQRCCMLIYPLSGTFNSGNWWLQSTMAF